MATKQPFLRIVTLLENNPYPADPSVRPHMEALAAAGHQVTVICPRWSGQPRQETINAVRVLRFWLPAGGTRSIDYVIEFVYATLVMTLMTLWAWLRYGMDVLHHYNPPDTLFVASLLPKLAGKTVVWDLRDLAPELYISKYEHPNSTIYRALLWCEQSTCRLADQFIVVNESYRQILIEREHIPVERIAIVRVGPDLDRVHPVAADPMLRARGRTIFAYLGKMAKQDGVDHLLRALSCLDRQYDYHDWFCVLIGKADDLNELQDLTLKLGIRDRTWFTGYVSDEEMIRYLSTADICIDPDPANPLNNISTMCKLMDYMAVGKPSVAYDLREHRVTAGEASLYAEPNDVTDLACKMMSLVEDPRLRAKMGQIGQQRLQAGLAWPFQRQKLLSVYEELAADKLRQS